MILDFIESFIEVNKEDNNCVNFVSQIGFIVKFKDSFIFNELDIR